MFKNSLNQIIGSILSAAINLIIVVFTANVLGASGRGEITYLLTCLGVLQILTSIVGNSVMIYMLTKHDKGNVLIASSVWTIFIILISIPFIYSFDLIAKPLIGYFLILALFQTCLANLIAYYSSELKFKKLSTIRILQPFTLIILILISYKFLKFDLNRYWEFLIISYLPFVFLYGKECDDKIKYVTIKSLKYVLCDFLKLGSLNQLTYLMQFLSYRFSVLVVAKLLDINSVGVFGMWLTIIDALWLIPIGLATVNMTYAAKKNYQLNLIYRFIGIAMVIPLVIIIVFSIIPNSIFILVLSKDFSQVKSLVLISAFSVLLFTSNLIIAYFFSAKGLIKYNTLSSGVGFISIICTTYFLTDKYGLIGAVLSNSLSYFLTVVMTFIIFYYKFYKHNKVIVPVN